MTTKNLNLDCGKKKLIKIPTKSLNISLSAMMKAVKTNKTDY